MSHAFEQSQPDPTPALADPVSAQVVLDCLPEGVVVCDAHGRLLDANPHACDMLGYPRGELTGCGIASLVTDPGLASTVDLAGGEIDLRCRDGSLLAAEVSVRLLPSSPGREPGRLWVFRDATVRRREEAALARRLEVLTRSADHSTPVVFEDLFDLAEMQRVQDLFAAGTGVASIITRPDGTPITRPSHFCRLCHDIIRQTEIGRRNCYCSDAILGRHHPEGPVIQPCLSGGLWDAGASITVGGQHVANWLIGQVRDDTQTEEPMRAYARQIGVDEELFLAAFREVPTMPRAQFEHVAQALHALAKLLSRSAYQNLQQARFIAERQRAEAALRAKTEELDRYFTSSLDLLCIAGTDGRFLRLNPEWEKVLGHRLDEMIGQGVHGLRASGRPGRDACSDRAAFRPG